MTFCDKEIDAFLPRELRRTGQEVKPPPVTAPAQQQVGGSATAGSEGSVVLEETYKGCIIKSGER